MRQLPCYKKWTLSDGKLIMFIEHGNSLITVGITHQYYLFTVHHDLKGDKKSIIISVVVQTFSLFFETKISASSLMILSCLFCVGSNTYF